MALVITGAIVLVMAEAPSFRGPGRGALPPARGPLPSITHAQVLVIQSHSNERYDARTCRGGDRSAPGPKDVTAAAADLARALSARGIASSHAAAYGADPANGNAYARMRGKLSALLAVHPFVRLVLDVHRDALDHAAATADDRGRPTARVLFVVGSRVRSAEMDWRTNLAVAANLTGWLQVHDAQLVRGIWVKPSDYNQDLGRPSALVEIGGWGSCPAEVARAIVPLANAVASYLKSTSPDPAAITTTGQMRPVKSSP